MVWVRGMERERREHWDDQIIFVFFFFVFWRFAWTNLGELLVGKEFRAGLLCDGGKGLGSKEQVLDQDVLEVGALFSIEACVWVQRSQGGAKEDKGVSGERQLFFFFFFGFRSCIQCVHVLMLMAIYRPYHNECELD
jgi:hypothetical protein